jgi:hypothetical protein
MRRFTQGFLTTSAILVLLVNLALILAYGHQFYACTGLCLAPGIGLSWGSFVVLNLVVIGTLLLLWMAIRLWVKSERH